MTAPIGSGRTATYRDGGTHRSGVYSKHDSENVVPEKTQEKTLDDLCRISNMLASNFKKDEEIRAQGTNSQREMFGPIDVNQVLL